MAFWNRKKKTPSQIHGGIEYKQDDDMTIDQLNGIVNNSFYAVDFAEALTDAPDVSEANQTGTPSVELVDNIKTPVSGGDPITYKKFKFKNLKGATGRSIIPAENGNQTITYEQLKAYAASSSEEYIISNSTSYNVGDVAIIPYTISDRNNTRGSVFVKVNSRDLTAIFGQGLGMSVAGADSLFYNGYLEFAGGSIGGHTTVSLSKSNFSRGPIAGDYFSLVIKTTETQSGNVTVGENGTYFCFCKISNVPTGDNCTANVNYYVKINGEDGEDGITPLTYKSTIEITPINIVIGNNYGFVTTSFARANTAAIPVAGEVFSAIVESGNSAANMGLFQVNSSVGAETSCKLLSLTRIRGDAGAEVELRATDDAVQWKYDNDTTWKHLIYLSTLKGNDGKNVELQKTTNYIQWRNVGDAAWQNLVALSELKGDDGQTPTIGENGNWYIGDTDTNVKAVGVDGTTFTPSVDANGNLSWTNDGSLENPETVNIKGAQGESATVQVGTVTTGAAGTNASVINSGNENAAVFDFTIPKGEDGSDGITPHIGDNGNWFIGETDTDVKAAGTDGEDGASYLLYSRVVEDPQTPYVGKSYGIISTYFNRTPSVDEEFLMQIEQTSDGTSYLCNAKVTSSTSAEILTVMELGGGATKTILPVIYSPIIITLAEIQSRLASDSANYYNAGNLSDFSSGDIGIVNANISGIEESSVVAGKLIILVTDPGGGAVGQRVGGRLIGYTYTPNVKIDVGIKQNEVINRSQSISPANLNTADFVENGNKVWAKLATDSTETVYTPLSASTMETPTLPYSQDTCCRQIGNNAYVFTSGSSRQLVKFDMSTEQLSDTSFTMSPEFNAYTTKVAKISDKIYVLYSGGIIEVSEAGSDVSQTTYSWNGTAPGLFYTAAAEHGNYVYLFGGFNMSSNNVTNSIIKVDIVNRCATTLSATLPQSVSIASAITSGENIYIFGGVNSLEGDAEDIQLKTIYKFNVETEEISTLSCELPEAGYGMSLCAKGQSIYLIGGYYVSGISNKIYEFDTLGETITDTGVVCPNISVGGSCASNDSAMYKFGGDQSGAGGTDNAITKIILSSQTVSVYEYKRLALYSEINNGGGSDEPSIKIVDGGSLTISGTGTSDITLSSDVVAQLVAEDVIGAKFDISGVDVLFNRTIYNPAAGSVSYTTATFECMTLALTGTTVTSIVVGVRSDSTTASLIVTNISGSGSGSVTKNDVLQVLGISEEQLNTLTALLGKTSVSDSTGITFSSPVNTTQYFNVDEQ